jgi:hypothetical protein
LIRFSVADADQLVVGAYRRVLGCAVSVAVAVHAATMTFASGLGIPM